ncbi:protein SMAX1-LIKE 8 [Mercurialis annua]|uniref:protein SMAX1-LIKE 8 n=1 Tax=Mercurialis annua TaxID=3986 RepID=UPI00215E5C76|nr:protein SMAX1-LIKE 8 [Mercurialis annua]
MPTPVTTARQCLTPESAQILDEAVAVAIRRGHNQTTSLHAVSALLTIPSISILRDACLRAKNNAYSPRLQFRALELCLSVSLDRVPSNQLADDPPVSNSLMAAIKRSQANQRRQPENFHLYHQQSITTTTSITCIKVELQNLVLSILDDPVVSRVFSESGFRSSEIKLAIVRPVYKLPRYKGPPMFLCNLDPNNSDPGRAFSFPFSRFTTGLFNGDENSVRISEILIRSKGRNPLLVGVSAFDTLANFTELLERKDKNFLPMELNGLSLISMEIDFSKFVSKILDKGYLDAKFDEMGRFIERNLGPGLVVNLGDLKVFINDENDENLVRYVVEKLTNLLKIYQRKIWFMGATENCESYLKFVGKFASIEKDWDLQLLPISSFRASMGGSYPRSSLMESFVPFGGFFSTSTESNSSLSQCIPRCHLCNEKCEQEVVAVANGGFVASVADHYQSNLPSWLQMTEIGTNKGIDVKTREDGVMLSAKIAGLQKKWDSICQRLHHPQLPGSNTHPSQFPSIAGFRMVEDKMNDAEKYSSNNLNAPIDEGRCRNVPIDLQKISATQSGVPSSVASAAYTENVKHWGKPSKEGHHLGDLRIPRSFSNSSVADGSQASPTSATSVTTDLGLRISALSASNNPRKLVNKNQMELSWDLSGSVSANVDVVNGSVSEHLAHSSSSSSSLDFCGQFDPSSYKMLFKALTEKVSGQDETVHIISQTIADSRTRNEGRQGSSLRRDLWFNFVGPDKCNKKKIAAALAEIIFGSSGNLISADLSPQDGIVRTLSKQVHGYDVLFRGKTVIDYIAGELVKKPLAVVFLENVDKADVQAQNCLSHAIQTGKFSDSHGREIGISNAIFVTTSTFSDNKDHLSQTKDFSTYSEERILRAKSQQIQILIEQAPADKMGLNLNVPMRKLISGSNLVNKRKLVAANPILEQHRTSDVVKRVHKTSVRYLDLDLNLPAEDSDVQVTDDGNSDNDLASTNSKAWLRNFLDQLDRIVVFKPFDFSALGEKILTEINDSFHKIVGSDCLLDIDSKVMEQLLAVGYMSNQKRAVEEWVEQVLSKGFTEVPKRYNLNNAHLIVKLVTYNCPLTDEHTSGFCLPAKILVN